MTDERAKPAGKVARRSEDEIYLPNRREVNKQISAELRAQRERERTKRRNAGAMRGIFEKAVSRRPNDAFGQLALFLRAVKPPAGTGRNRLISEGTQTKRGDVLKLSLRELKVRGWGVRNLSELRAGHVLKLVLLWQEANLDFDTIKNRVSHLRRFFTLIGRPNEIPDGRKWQDMIVKAGGKRMAGSQVRTVDRSAEAQGVDADVLAAQVATTSVVCAFYVRLQDDFGLRPSECIEYDYKTSDRGDHLFLLDGTKGRRGRVVPLSDDPVQRARQRQLLDEIRAYSESKGIRRLRERGYKSYGAMKNRLYYVMQKHGVTGSELGVTQYSFRHSFASRMVKEKCGLPMPVSGLVPPRIYREHLPTLKEAYEATSSALGHVRVDILCNYGSSLNALTAECAKRQRATLALVLSCTALVKAAEETGVEEFWIVGRAADGLRLAVGELFGMAVRWPAGLSDAEVQRRTEVLARAIQELRLPVCLEVRTSRPDFGLEVIFPFQERPRG
jgi:integrase